MLALSQDSAQLFEATRYSIRDLNLEAALAAFAEDLDESAKERA